MVKYLWLLCGFGTIWSFPLVVKVLDASPSMGIPAILTWILFLGGSFSMSVISYLKEE